MFLTVPYALIQTSVVDMILREKPLPLAVLVLLLLFSLLSWAIIFSKWNSFRSATTGNRQFLRAFRKAPDLQTVALAVEQFPTAPLVSVFDFGFAEVDRQVKSYHTLVNRTSLERSLQLGMSEQIARLENNMNWLATTATITPFIGLFGTVMGIIDAFQALGTAGGTSLRAVGPGISSALIATAMGLAAAIPAAIGYNYFGHIVREQGARMEDFSLEFMNLTERRFEK